MTSFHSIYLTLIHALTRRYFAAVFGRVFHVRCGREIATKFDDTSYTSSFLTPFTGEKRADIRYRDVDRSGVGIWQYAKSGGWAVEESGLPSPRRGEYMGRGKL